MKFDDKTQFYLTLAVVAIFLTAALPFISDIGLFSIPDNELNPPQGAAFTMDVIKARINQPIIFDASNSYMTVGIVSWNWQFTKVSDSTNYIGDSGIVKISTEELVVVNDQVVIINDPLLINQEPPAEIPTPVPPNTVYAAPADNIIDPPVIDPITDPIVINPIDNTLPVVKPVTELEGQTIEYIFTEIGTYEITLTITDGLGNTATKTVLLAVYGENIAPHALFNINNAVIEPYDTVIFDASDSYDEDGTISSWGWNVVTSQLISPIDDKSIITPITEPPAEIPTPVPPNTVYAAPADNIIDPPVMLEGQTLEYIFTEAGIYDITLRVTDDLGDYSEYTMTVLVSNPPIVVVDETTLDYTLTTNAGSDKVVYVGESVIFEGIATAIINGIPTPISDNTINSAPPVTNPVEPTPSGPTISLYEWDFNGDGTVDWSSPVASTITYVYNTAGTYTAMFTATDSNSISESDTLTITVLNLPASSIGGGGGGGTTTTYKAPDGEVQATSSTSGIKSITETDETNTEDTGAADITDTVSQLETTPLMTLFFITLVGASLVVLYVMFNSGKFSSKKK